MNALLPLAIGAIALLYASVGHAGATGYIAVMTLFGLEPAVIRPTALVLNVVVATIASVQFVRAGHFRPRLFVPLAAASVPGAAIGGAIDLPTHSFEMLVGLVLLVSALRLGRDALRLGRDGLRLGRDAMGSTAAGDAPPQDHAWRQLSAAALAVIGGGIGLLSGLTGVGGGVFLTPALMALGAAPVKQVAATTAPFILVNSLAGLAGGLFAGRAVPSISLPVIAAAVIGGAIGSQLGAFRLPSNVLRLLMAAVLTLAAVKLLGP